MDTDKAREVLLSNDYLYGDSPDDVSHIEYAIGAALHFLRKAQSNADDFGVALEIIIGKDSKGFFVSFPSKIGTDEVEQ